MYPKPTVTPHHTPHFETGRHNQPIVGICFHIAQGSRSSVVDWFANPASQVSSHYLINRDGSIDQFVQDEDTAWTQGRVGEPTWPLYAQYSAPNRVLIGIEHEGDYEQPWTEAMYQADLALCRYLCAAHKIKPERPYLLGHFELDSVSRLNCPGPNFPWDRLLADLQAWLPLPDWLPPVLTAAQAAGLSDGSRPVARATRAEAIALIMRAADARLPAPAAAPPAPAGAPVWLQPYISKALGHRITDASRLDDLCQRVEVMALAVRALAAVPAAHGGAQAAAALQAMTGAWDPAQVVAIARELGLSDGSRPDAPAMRGEAIGMALQLHQRLA